MTDALATPEAIATAIADAMIDDLSVGSLAPLAHELAAGGLTALDFARTIAITAVTRALAAQPLPPPEAPPPRRAASPGRPAPAGHDWVEALLDQVDDCLREHVRKGRYKAPNDIELAHMLDERGVRSQRGQRLQAQNIYRYLREAGYNKRERYDFLYERIPRPSHAPTLATEPRPELNLLPIAPMLRDPVEAMASLASLAKLASPSPEAEVASALEPASATEPPLEAQPEPEPELDPEPRPLSHVMLGLPPTPPAAPVRPIPGGVPVPTL